MTATRVTVRPPTGAAPLALLLDNKAPNHAPELDAVLDASGTLLLHATLARPQNKAHVEGAFGLFAQRVPSLVLDLTQGARSIARQCLALVAITWARAVNGRPRADRGGRSRVDIYAGGAPSDEAIAAARQAIEERRRRHELARTTSEARMRPDVRRLLDEHFERLGLHDPEGHVRLAIARYPLDAIVDGIAIFDGKRQAATLPGDVNARYLLGIVRNLAAKREGECVAEALLAMRLAVRDQLLAGLTVERVTLCDPRRLSLDVVHDCVDRALATDRTIDRMFWLRALTEELHMRATSDEHRRSFFITTARRINGTFRVPPRERQDAVCFVADHLMPLN